MQNAAAPSDGKKNPPASRRVLKNLPLVEVTADDLLEENNKECLVCLEGKLSTLLTLSHTHTSLF